MKVIIDANIWISYLLTLGRDTTINRVINFIFTTNTILLMPVEVETELRQSVTQKIYLSSRIPSETIEKLIQRIEQIAIVPPQLELPLTSYVSDRKDDYLISYGLLYNCEYLITGDGALLNLKGLRGLTILDPAQFWSIVE